MDSGVEKPGQNRPFREEWRFAPVFYTKDGRTVILGPESRLSTMAKHWLRYAIPKVTAGPRSYVHEVVTFPDIIGNDIIVETTPLDDIVYALRPGRRFYMRMARGRAPTPTQQFTIKLGACVDLVDTYVVLSAQIGQRVEMELEDLLSLKRRLSHNSYRKLRQRVKEFWDTHAYAMGSIVYLPETLTDRPPNGQPVTLRV
jgi:hypothetical protein